MDACDNPSSSTPPTSTAAVSDELIKPSQPEGSEEPDDETNAASESLEEISKSELEICNDHNFEVHEVLDDVQVFKGEWDDEGVYFYQAYNHDIADWAVENQKFGGPKFNPTRMTWIKPSFAWVLYRAGYGYKHNQERILKIKLGHAAVAKILSRCRCQHGGGGSNGRVQWDPSRSLIAGDKKEPLQLPGKRAIQIGIKGSLSEFYVQSVISIKDVTELSHKVSDAHKSKTCSEAMAALESELPNERPYMPCCSEEALKTLLMLPGGSIPERE
eukprot:TRINITY_DN19753_c0_g2_i1.p1 TRINITY_DN19753_c0_g2~~TRINITY_DN19753_c0_g2_i1.p1  ORF type:complete len:273 (-),score=38.32 TRINITY_DN19753_c0_g2_i1:305-1123(-)